MGLDWILFGLLGFAGVAVLLLPLPAMLRWGKRNPRPARILGGLFIVVTAAGLVAVEALWRPASGVQAKLPAPRSANAGFVTSNACKACHPGAHESWHQTFHRTMTQAARPETVVAAFDGRTLTSNYGAKAKVERVGDEFWVETVDIESVRDSLESGLTLQHVDRLPPVRRQVVMTTGSHFFQVYWLQSQNRHEYLQFPWRWHIIEKRWIHGYDAFVGPEKDWLNSPSKGNFARVWNGDCTPCHTLGPRPDYDFSTNRFLNTEVAELGISCESCHAPGQEHIRLHRGPWNRYLHHLQGRPDTTIVNPVKCNSRVSSEICGQCHSHALPVSENSRKTGRTYRAGAEFAAHLRKIGPGDTPEWQAQFWKDGTERAAGREFNGLAISACYLKGELSCSTCHSSHGGDRHHLITPRMLTNEACQSCHEKHVKQPEAHTHHAARSSGSLCYNCHMPHTSLGLLKAARSHRIDNPKVLPLASDERPNACNLCHLDKSSGWTAQHLHTWYGIPEPKLTDEERNVAAGLLLMLRGDGGQRAVTAWHAGWEPAQRASGTDWLAPVLAPLLDDPYAAVRFITNKSLTTLPGLSDWTNNFDGPPAQRQQSRRTLEEKWRTTSGRIQPRKPLEPVFDASGIPQSAALELLLKKRDDHPVRVDE